MSTAPVEGGGSPGEDSARALTMLNMLGGVMGAFQQQVAREAGAKEERARIANMGFFERRRYLKVHLT